MIDKASEENENGSRTPKTLPIGSQATSVHHRHYPFAIWVIFGGLVFSGLALLYGISPDLKVQSSFDIFFVPLIIGFSLLCFISAVLSLRRKRIGYILSILVSLGFAAPSLFLVEIPTISNPSDFTTFAIAFSSVPILLLVSVLSILCLVNSKKDLYQKKYLATPLSWGGVLTFCVLILVVAGIGIGGLQSHVTASSPFQSDVIIVLGASNPSSAGHFTPSSITVVIGVNSTVSWINHDYSIHTVTSDQGFFNSGLLNQGDKWSHTFTTPGTYSYHCTIHPYMQGSVVVKASA